MLKSGVSYNVYMKRVWIFDETLSPVCSIYYTLASPAGNSVSSYMCGTILFPSQRASKAAPAMCGKERVSKEFRGRKEGGGYFLFPSPPSPRFPSASPYSLSVLIRLQVKMFLSFFVLSDLERKSAPHV